MEAIFNRESEAVGGSIDRSRNWWHIDVPECGTVLRFNPSSMAQIAARESDDLKRVTTLNAAIYVHADLSLTRPIASLLDSGYFGAMAKAKSLDPFVCNEPIVEISATTSRILKQRMKAADEGQLVSTERARQLIQQWLSKSSTAKTR